MQRRLSDPCSTSVLDLVEKTVVERQRYRSAKNDRGQLLQQQRGLAGGSYYSGTGGFAQGRSAAASPLIDQQSQYHPHRTQSASEGLNQFWLYGPGNSAYASRGDTGSKPIGLLPPPPPPKIPEEPLAWNYTQFMRTNTGVWLKKYDQQRRARQRSKERHFLKIFI